jgi:hypothetical protein
MNRELIIEEEVKNYLKNDLYNANEFNFLVVKVRDFLDNFLEIVKDALRDDSEDLIEQVLSKIDLENEVQIRDYVRFYLQSLGCYFPNRWEKR